MNFQYDKNIKLFLLFTLVVYKKDDQAMDLHSSEVGSMTKVAYQLIIMLQLQEFQDAAPTAS